MKRKISILLIAVMGILIFTGCGGNTEKDAEKKEKKENKKATVLEIDKKNVIEDYAEITLVKIETTDKISAAIDGFISYESEDGEKFVDLVFDYKNLSTSDIDSEEFVSLTGTNSEGSTYRCNSFFVESGSDIDEYVSIKPMSTGRLHCAMAVDENEKALTLNLNVNGKAFKKEYKLNSDVVNLTPVAIGDSLESKDFAKITLKKIDFADQLLPSNTSGWYDLYSVDNKDNTYLIINYDITNLLGNAKDAEDFIGIKVIFDNKYSYNGFVVLEEDDKEGFDSYASLDPLETGNAFCLVEVPKSIVEKSYKITISFDGKEYVYEK